MPTKSKKPLKIDKNRSDAIIRCLNYLENNRVISNAGKPTVSIDIQYFFVQEILNAYLPLDQKIPERTRRRIISSSIFRWLKYKNRNISDNLKIYSFQKAIDTEIELAKKRISKFTVLAFLNVDPISIKDFETVDLLGSSLTVLSWNEVSNYDVSNLWQEVWFQSQSNAILWNLPDLKQPTPDTGKFTPLLFETTTYGPEAAIELASDCIDLFRCILNVPSVLGNYSYFRSEPKALSKILPSPIYAIFDKGRKRVSTYFTVEKFGYKQEKVAGDRKDSIKYLLSKFAKQPNQNSSWQYVLEILRQYQRALDVSVTESAYLAMWQVLENCIGFGDELTKNSDIQSRVKVFVGLDPLAGDMLEILIKRRNRFVHSGKYLEDGEHLYANLKIITDLVIRSLIAHAEKYHTVAELKEFAAFSSLGDDDLARKKSVIQKIEEAREKKK